MKTKIISYRKKKGDNMDYDQLVFIGNKIGNTLTNKEFRISKFKDRSAGFLINTNFVLTPKQIITLKVFLSAGLEK